MMKVHLLQKWDDALPEWMGEAKFQGVCWIYAIWQIFRANPLLLLCISYVPFLIRKLIWKWKKQQPRRVMIVVQGYERPSSERAADIISAFALPSFLTTVSHPVSGALPEGWQMVKYKSLYYIVHNISLACIRLCSDNDIYVKNHVPMSATTAVGMEISKEEALQLVFSGEYGILSDTVMECVPTWVNYVDVNTKIWGVLSSFPTLLQAANFNRLSLCLSLCIIVLDMNRHIIFKVYDRIFLAVANFVKENVFRDHTGLYHFFNMFSFRWKYTDPERKHCYKLGPDETFVLHPNSRLKSLEDLRFIGRNYGEGNRQDLNRWDSQYSEENFRRPITLKIVDPKVGIRVWWEEKFSLRVPFTSFNKLLVPRCLRDYLSYEGGYYRALGCTTFAEPFDVKARIDGKSILVE